MIRDDIDRMLDHARKQADRLKRWRRNVKDHVFVAEPEDEADLVRTLLDGERAIRAMADGIERMVADATTEAMQFRARAERAESALKAFVDYYDQAGMPRKLTARDESNPPGRFDGDEVFNVRKGRDVLRKAAGLDPAPGKGGD